MVLRLVVDDDEVSIEEVLDCSADDIREQGARAACLVAVVAMWTPETELMTEARDGSGASSKVPCVSTLFGRLVERDDVGNQIVDGVARQHVYHLRHLGVQLGKDYPRMDLVLVSERRD